MDVCVGVVFKGKDGLVAIIFFYFFIYVGCPGQLTVAIIFKNTGCVLEMHQQHYLFIYLLSHLDL
jgi:hypothetical protein